MVGLGLPEACPHGGGRLEVKQVACQYQEDLPPPQASVITRYDLQIGRCLGCRRRVQPRYPEISSGWEEARRLLAVHPDGIRWNGALTRRGHMATRTTVPHPSVGERQAQGKEARDRTPLSSHIEWAPADDRPDPVGLLEDQDTSR